MSKQRWRITMIIAFLGLVTVSVGVWRSTGPRRGPANGARFEQDLALAPQSSAWAQPNGLAATAKASSRVTEIVAQLDRGDDASTGLEFTLGADGKLVNAPTRRVALLDELGRADPHAAAAYARKLLSDFNSADEWAICLRNYALADSSGDARQFIEEKLRSMLTYEPWQRDPSAGFLEAFDVAVYLGGTNFMPVLTDLVRLKENPALSHAAYLALDRLVIGEPGLMLAHLLDHPEVMDTREATRANYFARADLSDPAQMALIEKYLLDRGRPDSELQTFAALFPSFNFMVSGNLLSRCETPDRATIARRDQAALRAVEAWLAEPRFSSVQAHLKTIEQRLKEYWKPVRSP